jgi:hypothetical protein
VGRKLLLGAAAFTVVLSGCTPQEIDAWLAWHNNDPEEAQAWLARPEVQHDLMNDWDQDGVVEPDPAPAVRLDNAQQLTTPGAPDGMSDCDEMMYYANQVGLPSGFRSIGWRESNCRNEDGVRTSCCHGYWQIHEMHFPIPECGAYSASDVNSDNPDDKRRQACAAKWLYDQVGFSAW